MTEISEHQIQEANITQEQTTLTSNNCCITKVYNECCDIHDGCCIYCDICIANFRNCISVIFGCGTEEFDF